MMDAKELRIGNLLQGKKVVEVTRIFDEDKIGINTGDPYIVSGNSPCLEPIPLTEEWLLKFGFEFYDYEIDELDEEFDRKNDFDVFKSYRIKKTKYTYLEVNLNPDGLNEFCIKFSWAGAGVLNTISYVHQLQNLYFALTGEELKTVK